MRFHWFKDRKTKQVEVLRFSRALLGPAPSPFFLGGVIEWNLENSRQGSQRFEEIRRSLYVDDLNGDGETVYKAQYLKESAQTIFSEAHFELQK